MGKPSCAEVSLDAAFQHIIYDSAGNELSFQAVFGTNCHENLSKASSTKSHLQDENLRQEVTLPGPRQQLLVIFIRHFFCGNCQEYLRSLASNSMLSSVNLNKYQVRVAVVGCGSPTLIESYRAIADIPSSWQLYADPSTKLYQILGMHRTLSLGDRSPKYIRRSLTGNMLRSMVQGIRRIPQGDALTAGGWDINGGEFLFELDDHDLSKDCKGKWKLSWCHRMLNSRDHTEVEELLVELGLLQPTKSELLRPSSSIKVHTRSQSTPLLTDDSLLLNEQANATLAKHKPGLRRSLSVRKQSWMNKTGSFARSMSLRVTSPT